MDAVSFYAYRSRIKKSGREKGLKWLERRTIRCIEIRILCVARITESSDSA